MRGGFVALDFETTGLSARGGDRIIELAALRFEGGAIVERLVSFVDPGFPIPAHISSITGISSAMVRGAPRACDVLPALVEFIGEDVVVAHNASFDAGFLAAECGRSRVEWNEADRVACTMKLARRIVPGLGSYKLASVASSVGVRFDGQAHRAEADARVAGLVMEQLAMRLAARFRLAEIDPGLLVAVGSGRAADLERLVIAYGSGREARGGRVGGQTRSRTKRHEAPAATATPPGASAPGVALPVVPTARLYKEGDEHKRAQTESTPAGRPGWKWIKWLNGR